MAIFQILKGSTSTWSTFRNQFVYFRTTCFYNPMKYCILFSFHINIIFFQMCFKLRHSVPIVFLTSPRGRIRHVFFICASHFDTYFQFTISHWLLSLRSVLSVLSYINKSFVTRMSYLLPRAKFQRVTFFMKRIYLLPRENFKLPYLPNQVHWDPGICSQLRSSHINSKHKKSSDFINGNFVYLALICAVWSSRGRAGKKVTAVTFFRCPTVILHETKGLCLNIREKSRSKFFSPYFPLYYRPNKIS